MRKSRVSVIHFISCDDVYHSVVRLLTTSIQRLGPLMTHSFHPSLAGNIQQASSELDVAGDDDPSPNSSPMRSGSSADPTNSLHKM